MPDPLTTAIAATAVIISLITLILNRKDKSQAEIDRVKTDVAVLQAQREADKEMVNQKLDEIIKALE